MCFFCPRFVLNCFWMVLPAQVFEHYCYMSFPYRSVSVVGESVIPWVLGQGLEGTQVPVLMVHHQEV